MLDIPINERLLYTLVELEGLRRVRLYGHAFGRSVLATNHDVVAADLIASMLFFYSNQKQTPL